MHMGQNPDTLSGQGDYSYLSNASLVLVFTSRKIYLLASLLLGTVHFLIANWTIITTIDRFRDVRAGRFFYAGELGVYTLGARFPACGAHRVATFAGGLINEASCEN